MKLDLAVTFTSQCKPFLKYERPILVSNQDLNIRFGICDEIPLLLLGKFCIQLNKYETAPNFIQLNQNLTSDCLLI